MKHQGRPSGHDVPNLLTTDVLGLVDNKTGRQIRRYIRLTELIEPLLLKVNNCDRLKSYFPKEYMIKQCEELLWKILEEWKRKN